VVPVASGRLRHGPVARVSRMLPDQRASTPTRRPRGNDGLGSRLTFVGDSGSSRCPICGAGTRERISTKARGRGFRLGGQTPQSGASIRRSISIRSSTGRTARGFPLPQHPGTSVWGQSSWPYSRRPGERGAEGRRDGERGRRTGLAGGPDGAWNESKAEKRSNQKTRNFEHGIRAARLTELGRTI